MPRVAIVVVTFNSAGHIAACLESISASDEREIVVVDNFSSDNTRRLVSAFARVRLIANPYNAGFAAAVNQGVIATEAPLVLLLNPDTRSIRGIDCLADEFKDPATGAAGGMLTNADGSPQTGFMYRRLPTPAALAFEVLGINRLWPGNRSNWHYRCLNNDPMLPCLVEQPAGAFLMFSREAWQSVGGFNESFYPIWFEDVDFCARLRSAGFRVKYNPGAAAVHAGAHSISTLAVENRERYWYGSLLEYAALHYGSVTFRILCFAVASGAMFRGVRSFAHSGSRDLQVYGAVCRLALSRLFRPRGNSGSSVV